MDWLARELSPMAAEIRVNLDSRNDSFNALLISDAHWDHPYCDRKKYNQAIDLAVERGAPIIYNGDTLCLMQTPRDPRQTKGKTREEHDEPDYFRAIAVDFANEHRHAAKNIALIGYGNHETAPLRHYSVDPVRLMADQLERLAGHRPVVGGYRGWLFFRFMRAGKQQAGTILCYYFHGSGGGGPVTKGVIQTARRNAFVDGADIIWTGHIHERWMVDTPVVTCNIVGREISKPRWHLSTPGFKEEFVGAGKGWHIERGAPPKPTGAAWLNVYQDGKNIFFDLSWTR